MYVFVYCANGQRLAERLARWLYRDAGSLARLDDPRRRAPHLVQRANALDPETILEELRRDFGGDLEIGGPTLAAGFVRRGLVDEYELVVHPVILGGGTPFFPDLERLVGLRLLETRTFSSGVVYLGFAAR